MILLDCSMRETQCKRKEISAEECLNKRKACENKVNGDVDLNPNGPKNTFGF